MGPSKSLCHFVATPPPPSWIPIMTDIIDKAVDAVTRAIKEDKNKNYEEALRSLSDVTNLQELYFSFSGYMMTL